MLGDTGNNLIEWIKFLLGRNMEMPHVKFIYPTAPVQKYTPMDGEYSNVWFDRKSISIDALECRKSMSAIYETVNEMLSREIYGCGIPARRVVVGGFSMGGCLAMHTGFHLNQNLGGVFALSAFLNNNSIVYDSLDSSSSNLLPKFKAFHGERYLKAVSILSGKHLQVSLLLDHQQRHSRAN
jgi:phospholipase/carboxylesterase